MRPALIPAVLFFFSLICSALGCTPSIGDACGSNADCRDNRICDATQPGGYCTVPCGTGSCPNDSTCFLFNAQERGCFYNDRVPARRATSYCMANCASVSDCRGGYGCVNPTHPPVNALNLDNNQAQSVCLPMNRTTGLWSATIDASSQAPICSPNPDGDPLLYFGDAGVPELLDAGDAGADAGDAAGPTDASIPTDAATDG